MDRNSANSISKITEKLHDDTDNIYEALMDENHEEASKLLDSMAESIKHLKTNSKVDEI